MREREGEERDKGAQHQNQNVGTTAAPFFGPKKKNKKHKKHHELCVVGTLHSHLLLSVSLLLLSFAQACATRTMTSSSTPVTSTSPPTWCAHPSPFLFLHFFFEKPHLSLSARRRVFFLILHQTRVAALQPALLSLPLSHAKPTLTPPALSSLPPHSLSHLHRWISRPR